MVNVSSILPLKVIVTAMSSEHQENVSAESPTEILQTGTILPSIQPDVEKSLQSSSDTEIGQGDAESSSKDQYNDKSQTANETASTKHDTVQVEETYNVESTLMGDDEDSDDVQISLDNVDDNSDDDIHLQWDDDEIEDDIISLKEPTSPEIKGSTVKIDNDNEKENQLVGDCKAKNVSELVEAEKPTRLETIENLQSAIDNICEEMKDDIDKIDNSLDDVNRNAQEEAAVTINVPDTKAEVVDDSILIDDDDEIDSNSLDAKATEDVIRNITEVETLKDVTANKDKVVESSSSSALATSSPNDSLQDPSSIKANADHGLNEPDVMLEIPTQEVIEFIDDTDVSCSLDKSLSSDSCSKHDSDKDIETLDKAPEIIDEVDTDEISRPKNLEDKTPATLNTKDDITTSSNTENVVLLSTDTDILQSHDAKDLKKPMVVIPDTELSPEKDTESIDTDLLCNDGLSSINKDKKSSKQQETIEDTTTTAITMSVEESKADDDVFKCQKPSSTTTVTKKDDIQLKTSETKQSDDLAKPSTSNIDNIAGLEDEIIKLPAKDFPKEAQLSTSDLELTNKPEPTSGMNEQKTSKSLINELKSSTIEINNPSTSEIKEPKLPTHVETVPVPSTSGINHTKPSITEIKEPESSTSSMKPLQPPIVVTTEEPQPSISQAVVIDSTCLENSQQLAPDTKDEVPEVTDSLGLLAESSRVVEDDEEPEDEEEDDDDCDDDQDESSNQMTAEHSEDSNAQHSETDLPKEQEGKEIESPQEEKGQEDFSFGISNIVSHTEKDADEQDKDGDMDVVEVSFSVLEVTPEQIGDLPTSDDADMVETTAEAELPKKAVEDKPTEAKKVPDIETVKLSDTSDNEVEGETSVLRSILTEGQNKVSVPSKKTDQTKSPAKKLKITQQTSASVLNYVDLEESSEEDDIQEIIKATSKASSPTENDADVSSITSVVEPDAKARTTRINTSEISIKTVSASDIAVIPQVKPPDEKPAPKFGLEVFNLDSDEEDSATKPEPDLPPNDMTSPSVESEVAKEPNKCINLSCKSTTRVYLPAKAATMAYYDAAARKKRAVVCEECADTVAKRTQSLVTGIRNLTPLLELDISKMSSELVEISDSESEDEAEPSDDAKEAIGEGGVNFLEEHLAQMFNDTWHKLKMDARLNEAQDVLNGELKMLEEESKEIDSLLNECQIATDKLRNDLYATFEHERHELPTIIIHDTPTNKYSCLEPPGPIETNNSIKRRLSSSVETPAKRPAIPLGYAPLDAEAKETPPTQDKPSPAVDASKIDDDKEVSVLQVSMEAAPSELPPPGEISRPPLRAGMVVYGVRNVFGSWVRCRVLEVQGKNGASGPNQGFTICRVKFENKVKNPNKILPGHSLAYCEPTDVRMTIGTRVIALFKDPANAARRDSFYSGIVAEVPNPVNSYRYLVFFDDGYAQYVRHCDTRLVCECSALVWEEVHTFSREFVREYLLAYPERPMVRLHAGQSLKTEWNGKWWPSRVIKVDASLVQVHFEEDNRTEWIYRGSTRLAPLYLELQAAERHRARPMPRTKAQPRVNMPYVEYTRSDEQADKSEPGSSPQQPTERETRQRAVAKKSTTPAPAPAPAPLRAPAPPPPSTAVDNVTSRVVFYSPKNVVKPHKMVPHNCGPHCRRTDVLALKDLRTYNPLAKPLLSGWERQIVRFKGHKEVMYRAPCGRRVRSMRELHRYLRCVRSDMAVDLFDFAPGTHCLAEFVLNTCLVGKKDLSHGKENVPVPCVNYYDESLPEFCSYNTERTPTAGVPLNLDPEFLCGCDCTDDCEDKSKCACWKMTLEGARTIGLEGLNVGYVYKRLPEPLPSGIYECNSRCKCKQTCLNRVAQHPLQLKLQVFKTLNRGWGIRALNDVPKGSFLCVYAGNLLTDATANMDGLNEGDEYLAELDYIEVVEQMKEGYEEDIPDKDKRLDRKNITNPASDESDEVSSSSEETEARNERNDDDFRPGATVGLGVAEFNKRLRKRDKKKQKEDERAKENEKEAQNKKQDDCITISDDEEVREPSRFMAQAGMESSEFKSKYMSVRSHFGRDEACYIMDAKVQGNIGRYLNHSCQPNVFVQNVFVDTHDPRFPWVAFFALSHVRAGSELTWNYNYDVGSVPGKILYCYCGAHNCRGRLL